MRFLFAIIIGKILRFAGGFVNRSTNLPGHVALKICPDLLKKIKVTGKTIAVTGSNGKTTTSNLIAHILRKNGYKVINNKEGSNMISGCTTTLVAACSMKGIVKTDFVVLEVDERHSRLVFKDLKLDYFLINNLLRDQVVRNGNPDIVMSKIQPETTLILNANDPITGRIAPENKRVYFGMDRTSRSTDQCENITHDCKVCPICFGEMSYNYYHYNHLGDFQCKGCGYKRPTPDFFAENVDFETGKFTINGVPAKVSYKTPFHFFNSTGATAMTVTCGVPIEKAIASLSTFEVSRERYDEFDVDGRKAVLMLTKQNPVSLDQSISFVLTKPEEKTIVFYVNNVIYLENKDISWLYDVAFEKLIGETKYIVCAGSRAYDVAVRLKLAGFKDEELFTTTDLSNFKDTLKDTKGTIYVLAASAFGDEDGVLEALK
ncbi:MAG: MurT ligase domain-containing protein [Oscillospiraceae bacterium]